MDTIKSRFINKGVKIDEKKLSQSFLVFVCRQTVWMAFVSHHFSPANQNNVKSHHFAKTALAYVRAEVQVHSLVHHCHTN